MRNRLQKLLLILNVVIGIFALIVMVAPLAVFGIFLLLGELGWVVFAMPTVFLYLLTFSICWWRIRPKGEQFAVLGGLFCCLFIGIFLPAGFNFIAANAVAEVKARNREPNETFGRVSTLGLKTNWPDAGTECMDLCLVLLYNEEVKRVVVYPGEMLPEDRKTSRKSPAVYKIEKNRTCGAVRQETLNEPNAWLRWVSPNELKRVVSSRIAEGECLVEEDGTGLKPDAVIRLVRDIEQPSIGLRLLPERVRQQGLEIEVGEKPYLVRLQAWTPLIVVPLTIDPLRSLDSEGRPWKTIGKPQQASGDWWIGQVTGFNTNMPSLSPSGAYRQ